MAAPKPLDTQPLSTFVQSLAPLLLDVPRDRIAQILLQRTSTDKLRTFLAEPAVPVLVVGYSEDGGS